MNIHDLSFTNIKILDPVLENNNYLFNITYNDKSFIFDVNDKYKFNYSTKTEFYFNKVKVFLNGRWVGITTNPIEFYNLHDNWFKKI